MEREINLNSNQKKLHQDFSSSEKRKSAGYKLKKDIVLYVLNTTLLESGTKIHDMINRSLYEKYRCNVSECFERPEYLIDVLRYVFNGSYHDVVKSLVKNLDIFAKEEGIKEFLHVLKTNC